ncbi:hypothetical protein QJS04_geneDACA021408 [Acorus gramineus]|uniref:Uncharacterized protein n=1 Tax=Acorus gramineus TaxID=55184 RepID=A0AAV9A5R9_ACOGR|nr:hypothetical protein QJS04_geneDACA021408 [Acorus gramineus]
MVMDGTRGNSGVLSKKIYSGDPHLIIFRNMQQIDKMSKIKNISLYLNWKKSTHAMGEGSTKDRQIKVAIMKKFDRIYIALDPTEGLKTMKELMDEKSTQLHETRDLTWYPNLRFEGYRGYNQLEFKWDLVGMLEFDGDIRPHTDSGFHE